MPKITTRLVVIGFVLLIVIAISLKLGFLSKQVNVSPSNHEFIAQGLGDKFTLAQVTKVIDGDTIEVKINNQTKKVRYIGIDTPETVDPHRPPGCFGKEASNEDKELLLNKQVVMMPDVEPTDKFGRLLEYVYLKLDNQNWLFVNDYLVRSGFALPDTIAPNVRFVTDFNQAAEYAKKNKLGLWSKCSL